MPMVAARLGIQPPAERKSEGPEDPDEELGDLLLDVEHFGAQGLRMSMEDECDIQRWEVRENPHISGPVCFMAVYDGHGGRGAAIHARDTVSGLVWAGLEKGATPEVALRGAYLGADKSAMLDGSGTTAVSVLVELRSGRVWCANAGDSRAILCKQGAAVALSEDHKPGNELERQRITAAGGRIARTPGGVYRVIYWKDDVYLSLACARAIGDNHYNQQGDVITATPDISTHRMTGGDSDYLLLACDGLWDVLTPEAVAELITELIREHPDIQAKQVSRFLCEQAIQMGSHDNVSVVFGWTPPAQRRKR